jgi:putative hydrolase of the HAD superfamily
MASVKAPNPLDPAEIEAWIFDLDNTLYPADCRLFDQVDRRIGLFIADFLRVEPTEARRIQKQYFRDHGTTLSGLMANHGVDPEAFLEYVHDIDMSPVKPSESLPRLLGRLEGLKIIFTNGSAGHAERVMARLGVSGHFDAVFDIAAAAYVPKPRRETYRKLIDRHEIEPGSAVIIDDIAENLLPAAELGMTTVWIRSDLAWAQPGESDDHIHLVADDLVSWLESVIERG